MSRCHKQTSRISSLNHSRSFEKRRMGFFDLMEGYRKSDALVSLHLLRRFLCVADSVVYPSAWSGTLCIPTCSSLGVTDR